MISIVGSSRSRLKRSSAFALVLGLLFSLLGSAAQASVTYSFSADTAIFGPTGSFTYTAPDFITTNIGVAPADLDACTVLGGACATMQFFADSSVLTSGQGDLYDVIGFAGDFGSLTATGFYYFDNGALSNVGSFATVLFGADQAGRLTVTSVPEPAPLALMSLALVALFIVRRRRPAA